jgi:SAM-dependent methyltransferase
MGARLPIAENGVAATPYRFVERRGCPACRSAAFRRLAAARFDSPQLQQALSRNAAEALRASTSSYVLDRCATCDLVYQRFVGDDRLLAELYGVWLSTPWHRELADREASGVFSAPRLSRDAHELMCISSWFDRPPESLRTLDYGMGWGLWARVSRHLGFESYGFDLAEGRMKAAADAGIRVVHEGALEPGFFDFINTDQVFEHVPDPLGLARRLHAALRPGGVLKICVPNGEPVVRRASRAEDSLQEAWSLNPVAPLEHVNCFTRKSLRLMGEEAGLQMVRPSLRHQFAFLKESRSIDVRRPALAAKSMIRPWHRYRNPATLYVWLQKPHANQEAM